jgi:hypothetical protein
LLGNEALLAEREDRVRVDHEWRDRGVHRDDQQSERARLHRHRDESDPNSNWIWFGFRQNANATEPAGNWAWECGTSAYTAPGWGGGEPNNSGGNEDCAALTNGGGWFDATCDDSARYLCELP